MDKTMTLLFGLLALSMAGAAFVGGEVYAHQHTRRRTKVTYTAAPTSAEQSEKIAVYLRSSVESALRLAA